MDLAIKVIKTLFKICCVVFTVFFWVIIFWGNSSKEK